jgi:cysteine sulfinate desulfinase/cysteine desulfurase-like protein
MRYFFRNVWVGIGRFLFIIHVIVGIAIYFELRRFWALGLSLREAAKMTSYFTIFDLSITKVIILAVVVPISITLLKYILRNKLRARIYETTRAERWLFAVVHIAFVAALCYLYWLYPYMQRLSGYVLQHGGFSYLYESGYYSTVNTYALPTVLAAAAVFVISVYGKMRISGKEPWDLITHYNLWLALAYPEGELYPAYSRKLNFNAGAISPEIRFISKLTRGREARYQKDVPGSREAANYLRRVANECKRSLFRLLKVENSDYNFNVEFHTGTSRAIELAIARSRKPLTVIVSPYEHPSELRVVHWILSQDQSIKVAQISFSPATFGEDWEVQEKEIDRQLRGVVRGNGENYLLLISEVCYATGMVIPLRRVTDKFRKIGSLTVNFLFDASHSVGNHQGAFGDGKLELGPEDFYVFGSHKWLLSPEPCGVSVTADKSQLCSYQSYDTWSDNLPSTTTGFSKIGSFMSSLNLILDGGRYENLMLLSVMMRDEFIKSVDDWFHVIGSSSNQTLSNMIALRPKDGYQWVKTSAELLSDYLSKIGVNCQVIDMRDGSLWVRLTFLYFITFSDIKQLRQKLRSAIHSY